MCVCVCVCVRACVRVCVHVCVLCTCGAEVEYTTVTPAHIILCYFTSQLLPCLCTELEHLSQTRVDTLASKMSAMIHDPPNLSDLTKYRIGNGSSKPWLAFEEQA